MPLSNQRSPSIALSVALSILQVGLSLGLGALLARLMSPGDVGLWWTTFSAILILVALSQFGLPELAIRETAIAQAEAPGQLWSGWENFDRMATPSILGALSIATAGFWLTAAEPLDVTALILIILHLPAFTLSALRVSALRGLGLGNLGHFLLILPVILTCLLVVAIDATGLAVSLTAVLWAHLSGAVIAALLTQVFRDRAARHYPPRSGVAIDREVRRALRLTSVSMAMVAGVGILNSHSDVLMVSWFAGAEGAALYAMAIHAAAILMLIRSQISLGLGSRIAVLWRARRRAEIAAISARIGRISAVISTCATVGSLIWGRAFLTLIFGSDYAPAAPILTTVCLAWTMACLFGAPSILMSMTGHQNEILKAGAISLVVNIGLNPGLILWLGPIGASVSLLLSTMLYHIIMWQRIRQHLGIDCSVLGRVLEAAKSGVSRT